MYEHACMRARTANLLNTGEKIKYNYLIYYIPKAIITFKEI
jgi:hypothetical protein